PRKGVHRTSRPIVAEVIIYIFVARRAAARRPSRREAAMSDEHTSFIQTPRQLAIVVALAFAVPVTLIVLLSQLVTGMAPGTAPEAQDEVLKRILPVGQVMVAEAGAPQGSQTGEQVYQSVCKTCHEAGLAGAPKIGDKSAWAPRIKQGIDTLYASALKGKNAMPPKGGNSALADVEVQRAVVFMANQSGATFKEPAAPAVSAASGPTAAQPSASPAAAAPTAKATAATTPAAGAPLDLASGTAMMQKDGCSACHAVDKKIVGPSYEEV